MSKTLYLKTIDGDLLPKRIWSKSELEDELDLIKATDESILNAKLNILCVLTHGHEGIAVLYRKAMKNLLAAQECLEKAQCLIKTKIIKIGE